MKESQGSGDAQGRRDQEVDEAFGHWDDLARLLGAEGPDEDWDRPRQAADEAKIATSEVPGGAEVSPPAEVTDWNQVADTLGIVVAPDFEEVPDSSRSAEDNLPTGWRPAEEMNIELAREVPPIDTFSSASPSPQIMPPTWSTPASPIERNTNEPPATTESPWRSLWSDADAASDRPGDTHQAALDKMFGADSSRVYEREEEPRPQYFDLIDEESEIAEEVRFVPQEQSQRPDRGEGKSRNREDKKDRGRRSRPRRRGRQREESQEHEEPAERHERPKATKRPDSSRADAAPVRDRSDDDDFDGFGAGILEDEQAALMADAPLSGSEALEDVDDLVETSDRRGKHRKVVSWKEAVGAIVDRNMQSRDKDAHNGGHRRRRGGGGGRRR